MNDENEPPTFRNIQVDKIQPASEQPRQDGTAEEIQDLALSIKENGLSNPIEVMKESENCFTIITGERRYNAVKEVLQQDKILCQIYTGLSDEEIEFKRLVENLRRKELNPADKIRAAEKLFNQLKSKMENKGRGPKPVQKEMSKKLGTSEQTITSWKKIWNKAENRLEELEKGETSINQIIEDLEQKEGDGTTTTESPDTTSVEKKAKKAITRISSIDSAEVSEREELCKEFEEKAFKFYKSISGPERRREKLKELMESPEEMVE